MNTIEDRLRGAYQSATQTVRPESLRPSVLDPAGLAPPARCGPGRLGLPRLRGGFRWLAPLAAALAVVAVAVAAVTVPRLFHGRPAGPAVGGTSIPSPFLVVVQVPEAKVVVAATGRVVAELPQPGDGLDWTQAAAGQSGRQFLLAAEHFSSPCASIQFYLLTLSGTGTVASLRPYSAPLAHRILNDNNWITGALAVSADGSTVAYASTECESGADEMITVIRHGTVRTWTAPRQENVTSLSLSANGSLLGYVDLTNAAPSSAWILRTDSAPGPADQHARRVFIDRLQGGPLAQSAVLSPDGSTMYLLTGTIGAPGLLVATYAVSAYDTATGARLRTLRTWHDNDAGNPPSLTASGGRALIWYVQGSSIVELNLTSGTATTFGQLRFSVQRAIDIAW